MLAAGVRVQRPREPHVLDRVERRLGRSSDDGQNSLSTHSSQRGRRAKHTLLPCRISRRDRAVHSSFGTTAHTWYSIFTGSLVATIPSRFVSLFTWVSTAKPGES